MAVETKPRWSVKDFRAPYEVDWCPGCGDYGILNALYQALAQMGVSPYETVVVGGIGCSGKAQYYVNGYGVHTLHGRPLPVATGIKLANPNLKVFVVSGDGDSMAIGAAHFVNGGRRNVDITYIMFNNEVYGLTKGQASPTLPLGLQTKSLPEPNIQGNINPLMLAFTTGYTWIGRGYAYNIKQLVRLIREATEHPGLAFLEVLQPCPTYNNLHTKDWYQRRLYDINEEGYDPVLPPDADDATRRALYARFMEKVFEWGDRIPTGVFLVNRNLPTFEERIAERQPHYRIHPPALMRIRDDEGRSLLDIQPFYEEHRAR